jgi:YHS domain-containing protein
MRRRIFAMMAISVLTMAVFAAGQSLQPRKAPDKAKDPVCGLMVDKDPKLSTNYKGETYYFCSKTDLDKFKKEPEKYVRKK